MVAVRRGPAEETCAEHEDRFKGKARAQWVRQGTAARTKEDR